MIISSMKKYIMSQEEQNALLDMLHDQKTYSDHVFLTYIETLIERYRSNED